jgi:enoyl-[acyl-carrier protein] reductase III
MEFRDRKALITGGTRGIGRAITLALARGGADVAVNYLRNRAPAEEMRELVAETGRRCLILRGNVADPAHLDRMFAKVREEFGRLDVLVSNAASGVLKPATELTQKHWRWTMDINAGALLMMARHAVDLMGEEGGKVVAVSSLGAVRAIPHYTAVGASKAALESLVRHLAAELAGSGVNVNAISAGTVNTDALKHFPNREEMLEGTRRRTPAGRLVTPENVADAVMFLCSDRSSMVHGQTLTVDGGYSIVV